MTHPQNNLVEDEWGVVISYLERTPIDGIFVVTKSASRACEQYIQRTTREVITLLQTFHTLKTQTLPSNGHTLQSDLIPTMFQKVDPLTENQLERLIRANSSLDTWNHMLFHYSSVHKIVETPTHLQDEMGLFGVIRLCLFLSNCRIQYVVAQRMSTTMSL